MERNQVEKRYTWNTDDLFACDSEIKGSCLPFLKPMTNSAKNLNANSCKLL